MNVSSKFSPPSSYLAGAVLALGTSALLAGCGGVGAEMPRPISKHFDEVNIARIPVDQKQTVLQTQTDWNSARMVKGTADFELEQTRTMLDIADNQRQSARLNQNSASKTRDAAATSMDQTRINAANKDVDTADQGYAAAAARLAYIKAYRSWIETQKLYAEESMYWQEARYENAKADIARQNSIKPSGFEPQDYARQEVDRAKKVQKRKAAAASARSHAESARSGWQKAQDAADQLTGQHTALPDPMLAKSEITPTTSTGTTPTPTSDIPPSTSR